MSPKPPKLDLIDPTFLFKKTGMKVFNEENQKNFKKIQLLIESPQHLIETDKEKSKEFSESLYTAVKALNSSLARSARLSIQTDKNRRFVRYQKIVNTFENEKTWQNLETKIRSARGDNSEKYLEELATIKKLIQSNIEFLHYSPEIIRRLLQEVLPAFNHYLRFVETQYHAKKGNLNEKERWYVENYIAVQQNIYENLKTSLMKAAWLRLSVARRTQNITYADPLQYFLLKIKKLYKPSEEVGGLLFEKNVNNSSHYWMSPKDFQCFQKQIEQEKDYEKFQKTCFWSRLDANQQSFELLNLKKNIQVVPKNIKPYFEFSGFLGWLFNMFNFSYVKQLENIVFKNQGIFIAVKNFPASFETQLNNVEIGIFADPRLQYLVDLKKSLIDMSDDVLNLQPSLWSFFLKKNDQIRSSLSSFCQEQMSYVSNRMMKCLENWVEKLEVNLSENENVLFSNLKNPPKFFNFLQQRGIEELLTETLSTFDKLNEEKSLNMKKKYLGVKNRLSKFYERCYTLEQVRNCLSLIERGEMNEKDDILPLYEYINNLSEAQFEVLKSEMKPLMKLINSEFIKQLTMLMENKMESYRPDYFARCYNLSKLFGDSASFEKSDNLFEKLFEIYYENGAKYLDKNISPAWFENVEDVLSTQYGFKNEIEKMSNIRINKPALFHKLCCENWLGKMQEETAHLKDIAANIGAVSFGKTKFFSK